MGAARASQNYLFWGRCPALPCPALPCRACAAQGRTVYIMSKHIFHEGHRTHTHVVRPSDHPASAYRRDISGAKPMTRSGIGRRCGRRRSSSRRMSADERRRLWLEELERQQRAAHAAQATKCAQAVARVEAKAAAKWRDLCAVLTACGLRRLVNGTTVRRAKRCSSASRIPLGEQWPALLLGHARLYGGAIRRKCRPCAPRFQRNRRAQFTIAKRAASPDAFFVLCA